MKRCKFCGTDLPVHANFCGNCGRPLAERTPVAFDYTHPEASATPAPNTPPLFSSLLYAIIVNHARGSHTSRLHGLTAAAPSEGRVGIATRWLIVALAAVAVVITSGIIIVRALTPATPSPGLTFTGSSVVPAGGILHVHGQGFTPGGSIQLTIDNGLAVSLAGQFGSQPTAQEPDTSVPGTGLASLVLSGAFQPRAAAGTTIAVNTSGAFDAGVSVPRSLSAGVHTLHATELAGSQRASLPFTIPAAQLTLNPTALHFGSLAVGRTATRSVTVSNSGGSRLNWTATLDGSTTQWLTLHQSAGAIEANGRDEPIPVTVTTNRLPVGPYAATVHLHSNGGNATLLVLLAVTATTPTTPPTATPSPSPTAQPSPSQPQQITVTPLRLLPTSSNCSPNSDGTYNCSVTVGETVPGKLHWFSFVRKGGTGTSISPSSGTLSASHPQQLVTIASIPCHYGRFTFTDQNSNTVNVTWRCRPLPPPPPPLPPPPLPTLMINPTSIPNSTLA